MQMDETIKTLRMHWSPSDDKYVFRSTSFQDTHTKRTVISDIAKLFDPNGPKWTKFLENLLPKFRRISAKEE